MLTLRPVLLDAVPGPLLALANKTGCMLATRARIPPWDRALQVPKVAAAQFEAGVAVGVVVAGVDVGGVEHRVVGLLEEVGGAVEVGAVGEAHLQVRTLAKGGRSVQ